MARRLALAAVIALVPEQSLLQPQLVSVVLFGSIVAQLIVQPYSRAVENVLEVASLSMLLVTYNVATAMDNYGWNEMESSWQNQTAASIVLLVLNILMILAFLAALGWPYVAALGRAVRRLLRLPVVPAPNAGHLDHDLREEISVLREEISHLRTEITQLRRRHAS